MQRMMDYWKNVILKLPCNKYMTSMETPIYILHNQSKKDFSFIRIHIFFFVACIQKIFWRQNENIECVSSFPKNITSHTHSYNFVTSLVNKQQNIVTYLPLFFLYWICCQNCYVGHGHLHENWIWQFCHNRGKMHYTHLSIAHLFNVQQFFLSLWFITCFCCATIVLVSLVQKKSKSCKKQCNMKNWNKLWKNSRACL